MRSIKAKTFKETAQQFGAPTSTVMRRFDGMVKKELKVIRLFPHVIAIVEYKGVTKAFFDPLPLWGKCLSPQR